MGQDALLPAAPGSLPVDATEDLRRELESLRLAVAELRHQEEAFQQLADCMAHGVYRNTTGRGKMLYANAALARMFGYESVEAILAVPVVDLYQHESDRTAFLAGVRAARGGHSAMLSLRRRDGTPFWARCTAVAHRNHTGEIEWMDGILEDVTEREPQLRPPALLLAELRKLEAIINRSHVVAFLWRIGENWPVEFVSANVGQFGYGANEFLNGRVSWVGITHPDDVPRLEDEVKAHLAAGRDSWDQQYRLYARDGSLRWIEDRNLLVRDADGAPTHVQGIILDVTQRKLAELAQRASEARWRALAQTAVDFILLTDLAGRITFLNHESPPHLPSLCTGADLESLAEPGARREIRAALDAVTATRAQRAVEFRTAGPTATPCWLHMRLGPCIEDDTLTGVMALVTDISERRAAAERLHRSEERLRGIAENIREVFWMSDSGRKSFEYVSPAFETIWGWRREDVLRDARFWSRAIHREDRARVRRAWRAARSTPREMEYRIQRPDGTVRWIRERSSPLRPGDARDGRVVGVAEDVTTRRLAEDDRRSSEESLRDVIDALPDITCRIDAQGLVRDVRLPARLAIPFDANALVGREAVDVARKHLAPAVIEEFLSRFGEVLRTGKPASLEHEALFLGAATGTYETRLVRISLEEVLVMIRDVSEQRATQKRLLEQQGQLRALATELSLTEERERRRIAGILHDKIGQDLASCQLRLSRYRRMPVERRTDEPLDTALDVLAEAMADMRKLTHDIYSPLLEQLGFEAAVAHLGEQIAADHGLQFAFHHDGSRLSHNQTLSDVLFRAVSEALHNVVKHAQARRMAVHIAQRDGALRVAVEDDGHGFDAHDAGTHFSASGGFGLFSVGERLRHLGGELRVRSAPGQGAQVLLSAPLDGVAPGNKGHSV